MLEVTVVIGLEALLEGLYYLALVGLGVHYHNNLVALNVVIVHAASELVGELILLCIELLEALFYGLVLLIVLELDCVHR